MDAYRVPHHRTSERAAERKTPAVFLIGAACTVIWAILAITQETHIWQTPLGAWIIDTAHFDLRGLFFYHLIHDSWLHLLANVAVIVYVGRRLEARWGSMRFVLFYLACAVGCGLVTYGVDALVRSATDGAAPGSISFGASGAAFGCLAAYILLVHDRPVISFFTERYLLWAGMIIGAALLVLLEHLTRVAYPKTPALFTPQLAGIAIGTALCYPITMWSQRGQRQSRVSWHHPETVPDIRMRVDEILEKISRTGMKSLSRDEESFLRAASKHFRNRH